MINASSIEEGKVIESSKGSSGSWTEPAEPPIVVYELLSAMVSGLDPTEHCAGMDISGYCRDEDFDDFEGEILTIEFVGHDEAEITFTNATVTHVGMIPSQSMKGCL